MVLRAENDVDRIHAGEYIRRSDIINPVKLYDPLAGENRFISSSSTDSAL
jgi:hypothetical protein